MYFIFKLVKPDRPAPQPNSRSRQSQKPRPALLAAIHARSAALVLVPSIVTFTVIVGLPRGDIARAIKKSGLPLFFYKCAAYSATGICSRRLSFSLIRADLPERSRR